jgi:hypothetical protein
MEEIKIRVEEKVKEVEWKGSTRGAGFDWSPGWSGARMGWDARAQ